MSTDVDTLPHIYNDHVWPDNLFSEMYEMCMLSFMVYQFGYLVDAARKSKGFVGLSSDESNPGMRKSQVDDSELERSFTPEELKNLIQDNIEILSKYKNASTFRGDSLDRLYQNLDLFTKRGAASTDARPLTIEEFDDKYQNVEPVYGLCKDVVNRRITVVFRGSDTLAFWSNWKSNVSIAKKRGIIPESLKNSLEDDNLCFHSGFYNYLFNKTKDETDDEETTKYDQIYNDLKAMLAKNPGFKVYVTGHSLGGALSTILAFYLSCDPDIPKPVSIVSFGAPRVGNMVFLKATQMLEKTSQLRILRSVNENDTVTVTPSIGYKHVGFQVTTYAPRRFFKRRTVRKPDITYPNLAAGPCQAFSRRIDNSYLANFNLGYDHTAYLKRIFLARVYLEDFSLNLLYADEDVVGFQLQSPENAKLS